MRVRCLIVLSVIMSSHAWAAVENFMNPQQYPLGRTWSDNGRWAVQGESIQLTAQGLVLQGDPLHLQHTESVVARHVGDAVTVSVDFRYEQVADVRQKNLLLLGLTNGDDTIWSVFYRMGWGSCVGIGSEDTVEGAVFELQRIGLRNNQTPGVSDPMRFTLSLVKQADECWDMVLQIQNLNNPDFKKRWEKKGVRFEHGGGESLAGVVKVTVSDEEAGVANRMITRFAISDTVPPPAPLSDVQTVSLKDYFRPMEPQGPLVSEGIWGNANAVPRDIKNGLEDSDLSDWCYWDGGIVKDDEGKYHLFASRWNQKFSHHDGWTQNSKGTHAVSDHIMGPYIDRGMPWPHWKEGAGHNVFGFRLHDGRYGVVTSERTYGDVFVSDSPDGPFKRLGAIQWEANGFDPGLAAYQGGKGNMSNVMILPRPDGRYMIVPRTTCTMISDNGVLGPYKIVHDRVYKKYPELPQGYNEDPTVWYSGGRYHIVYNHWPSNTSYHFTSEDGIQDWTYRGIAFKKNEFTLFRYTNGAVNKWEFVERPTAYVEDGHVTHFIFSVLDVHKGWDDAGDNHGSKIVVVPFDGEAFDRDMQALVDRESEKTLVDFFLPMEPQGDLVEETWGKDGVLPRDVNNGLEDADLSDWCYWDGSIVKDDEGTYHMYASRWTQSVHHSVGWNKNSKGMHAVSDDLLGPYVDQGLAWPHWHDGAGHNVIGLRLHDGRYAMVTSEVTPGNVFVSDSPTGPWTYHGAIKIDNNGFYRGLAYYDELDVGAVRAGTVGHMANVMIITRPDGRYMIVARHCVPMISDHGILGPYKIMADKAWRGVAGMPQFKNEDPTVWYSDGLYHIAVNHYVGDNTYHLTSEDGLHNWKVRGLAYRDDKHIFRYTDGTVNQWYTVQRPTVYTENGQVKAFNFSVIDVHKGQDGGNDKHGSKIVVVPFDGEAFNRHIRSIVDREHRQADRTPAPAPWQSVDIGFVRKVGNTGFETEYNTLRVKAAGNRLDDCNDACRFVYQEMSGDVSATVLVLSQDITDDPIKAGLMIRQSLQAESPMVAATISHQDGLCLERRLQSGDKSETLHTQSLRAPYWLRLEKRGNRLTAFISSSNRMNWTRVGETEVVMGERFFVGLAATSQTNQGLSLARFKDVDIHPWGEPVREGIVSHNFPDVIPASGVIDFEIAYETRQTLDVWVELQDVLTEKKYPVLRQRLGNKGTMALTYQTGTELEPGAMCWFVIKAVPMHFHDSEHVQSCFKKVFVEK